MPRIKETEVYKFDELSDRAKERARDWYREHALDYDWWDCIYENAEQAGKYMGLDLNQKPVKLMSGATRYDPEIYFEGFYTQGSGSTYGATWQAWDVKPGELKKDFASDEKLHHINDRLETLAKENPEMWAKVSIDSQYYGIRVEVGHGETRDNILNELEYDSPEWKAENAKDEERQAELIELLEDFNRWIYRTLEKEYEWRMSDKCVDEDIRANEYEFTEEGECA